MHKLVIASQCSICRDYLSMSKFDLGISTITKVVLGLYGCILYSVMFSVLLFVVMVLTNYQPIWFYLMWFYWSIQVVCSMFGMILKFYTISCVIWYDVLLCHILYQTISYIILFYLTHVRINFVTSSSSSSSLPSSSSSSSSSSLSSSSSSSLPSSSSSP